MHPDFPDAVGIYCEDDDLYASLILSLAGGDFASGQRTVSLTSYEVPFTRECFATGQEGLFDVL